MGLLLLLLLLLLQLLKISQQTLSLGTLLDRVPQRLLRPVEVAQVALDPVLLSLDRLLCQLDASLDGLGLIELRRDLLDGLFQTRQVLWDLCCVVPGQLPLGFETGQTLLEDSDDRLGR